MRKVENKSKRILAELLRGQEGVSIVLVVFVMLVLSAIGYSMARMMATKQMSVPVVADSSNAFAMAESGINWAGKHLSDLRTWSSGSEGPKTVGNGSFTVTFTELCWWGGETCEEGDTKMCITVQSKGTYGDGERRLRMRFCREQGEGCTQ
jgi:Tfp pilus assembly protein PilX